MDLSFKVNIAEIIAVTLSFLAFFIALKNRRNALRENVFNRQIEALMDILNKMDILDLLIEDMTDCIKISNKKKFNEIKIEVKNSHSKLEDTIEKYILILPEKLEDVLSDYTKYVEDELIKLNENNYEILYNNIIDKYIDVEELCRNHLGLEKLSRENRRLVKSFFLF